MNRVARRAGLIAGCAGIAIVATPAFAQDAAPSEPAPAAQPPADESPADIIVTARRQNERLLDVPASVTVLSADTLAKTGVVKAENFVALTPGVTIVTGTAESGDTQINIRGINGARDAESSVALVVDGILKTNTAQLNEVQGTLRQVEILKGPQGALYGRNAAAGAIVLSTIKPGDRMTGAVTGTFAEQGTWALRGYAAGPISNDAGIVISANYKKSDGFYRNFFLDCHCVDDSKIYGIDGRLVVQAGPNTELDFKARFARFDGASIAFNAAFHLPNFAAVNPAFYEDVNDHPFNFYSNIRPTNDQKTYEASAKLEHDFGATKLTAWALYSNVKQNLVADGTSADFARYIAPALGVPANPTNTAVSNACFASTAALTGFPVNQPGFIGQIPVPFIFAPANGSTFGPYSPTTCDGTQYQVRNQTDWSAEVRLASDTASPVQWQLGAYYLHINRLVAVSLGADLGSGVIRNLYNDPSTSNPTSQLFADRFTTNVYAGFGSVDWKPSDQFKLGLALRYDIEARQVSNRVPLVTDPILGGPLNPGQVSGAIPDQKKTFRQLEPKINVSFRPNSTTNIYANWGIGFKSGGFNNSGSSAIIDANFNNNALGPTAGDVVSIDDQFRKERSSAFEAGIKGSFLNGKLTYDLAGYYTRITDMQFFEFFVGSFGLLRVVSNIDRVDVKGVELNLNAKPLPGWSIFGSVNVTDSEIKKNRSRPYTVGNKSPYTADYTINLGTQLTQRLGSFANLVARADYRITGPTWFHTVQGDERPTLFSALLPISALGLPAFVGNAKYDVNRRDKFGVLNLRLGLETDRWSVTAFADNALDKKWLAEVIPAIEFGGSFLSPGTRRQVGVEVGVKF
ncbi:TonB-dependent receptor [Sphingomonas jaspsi]|uniref:TonB-dependent receptor n=1 Tax=Sphingomonas jaspsi TaxID=392409 RepID=UPI0006886AB5|nr:TonB-dependent receptor [Sphingomonas jaspsi]